MIPIPPNFSLYNLIDLHDVNSIFAEQSELLAYWSKSIESAVIEQQLPAQIIAGFQHIGRITPLLRRYRRLASVAKSVILLGLPDANPDLTGMTYIALEPESALIHEWVLIVKHSDYVRALIAREDSIDSRGFHGVMTSDPAQVERYYAAAIAVFADSTLLSS